MTDIVLTSEHDLLVTNEDLQLFSQLENLTAQRTKINLLNYRGEWFLDVNTGVPYLQSILGRRNTKESADVVLKDTIINTENISRITSYNSFINNERRLVVVFSALLESGGKIENVTVEI